MKGEKMKYPILIINKRKLEENTRFFIENCNKYGVEVTAVTKCYCAIPELAEAQVRGGARMLADSRIENLKKLVDIDVPKMLVRIPMLSEIEDVVEYTDISLNSEIEVVKALSAAAIKRNKKHKVMLMIDVGDLREGCLVEDALTFADEIIKQKGVILSGIGANFSCISGVMPDKEKLEQLIEVADKVYQKHRISVPLMSGGNSCTYFFMKFGEMPQRINHLRLGGIILHGYNPFSKKFIEGAHSDVFTLAAEIIEVKAKPSMPFGEIGLDAFGNVPMFSDNGIRKRALLAIGKQDVKIDAIYPKTPGVIIIGASSDHLVVDVTNCAQDYKVGDVMEFGLFYGGILTACTSDYVSKHIK